MKHLPALDGLRAVAILIVACSHIVTTRIPGGFGVTLFFFISGFIITRMMLSQSFSAAHFKSFYLRRVFRLAPALFVYLLVAAAVIHLLGGEIPLKDFAATLFYYANYHTFSGIGDALSPLGVTWSLSVEEHFYLVFPLLLVFAGNHLIRALVAIIDLVLVWRLVLVYGFHVGTTRTYESTDTRLDSIAWGCLLSAMIHVRRAELTWLGRPRAVMASVVLLAATLLVRDPGFRETVRYTLQGLALVPIFTALFWNTGPTGVIQRALESRPARYIGNISYSLYLYHFLALSAATLLFGSSAGASMFALTFGLIGAIASYHLVENPMRRIGSRLANALERVPRAGVHQHPG